MLTSICRKKSCVQPAGTSQRRPVRVAATLLLAIDGLIACGPPPRGLPLYDASHGVLPLEQVARISGQIIAIDGQRIKQDTQRFEVLPGCHMLRMTGTVGYWTATATAGAQLYLGEHQFGVHTEAGHQYFVELEHGALETSAPVGRVQVQWVVKEFDAQGKEHSPVRLYTSCSRGSL